MLPNIQIPPLKIYGPIVIAPFGVLVAIAVITGLMLAKRRAKVLKLDLYVLESAMFLAVFVGFVVAHLVSAFLYYPVQTIKHPLVLLDIRSGLSSFGGFTGGFVMIFVYLRRKGLPLLKYSDAIMFGMVPAWIVGRMGCTVAFDHPGLRTQFFLGMADNLGVVRHNLGFYEMLFTVALTIILYSLKKFKPFAGFHTALMLLLYSPARFLMDFLRIEDKKYLGFTPGQYFCVIAFTIACIIITLGFKSKSHEDGS